MIGNAYTNFEIKKELSICQSLSNLDLVSFPVLSQIKPQAPVEMSLCSWTPPNGLNLRWGSGRRPIHSHLISGPAAVAKP